MLVENMCIIKMHQVYKNYKAAIKFKKKKQNYCTNTSDKVLYSNHLENEDY